MIEYEASRDETPVYLRYPIDAIIPDMPGRPIQNNEGLAEAMAYAEDPYRELARHAQLLGLKDVENNLIVQAQRNAAWAEAAYYESFGTTKREAKSAMRQAVRLYAVFHNPRREENMPALEYSRQQLDDVRGAVRAFGSAPDKISAGLSTIVHCDNTLRDVVELYEAQLDSKQINHEEIYRPKVQLTLGRLFKAAKFRRNLSAGEMGESEYPTATDATKDLTLAAVADIAGLLEYTRDLEAEGVLDWSGAERLFSEYDVARYSVGRLRAIGHQLTPTADNLAELIHDLEDIPERYARLYELHLAIERQRLARLS
jgi:hypothetical protein